MKVWKGSELEGEEKGVMTLFYKSQILCPEDIINWLNKNTDCRRLYLGAGRTDITLIDNQHKFKDMIQYCTINGIRVVCENSLENIDSLPGEVFEEVDQLIIRVQNKTLEKLRSTDVLKIDTEANVYTKELEQMIATDLKELSNDTFVTDTVIYSDEE